MAAYINGGVILKPLTSPGSRSSKYWDDWPSNLSKWKILGTVQPEPGGACGDPTAVSEKEHMESELELWFIEISRSFVLDEHCFWLTPYVAFLWPEKSFRYTFKTKPQQVQKKKTRRFGRTEFLGLAAQIGNLDNSNQHF